MFNSNAAARSKSKMPTQPIKLYYLPPSPPCRSVMMVARVLGIDLDLVVTNIMEGQHMTPEFLKVNRRWYWMCNVLEILFQIIIGTYKGSLILVSGFNFFFAFIIGIKFLDILKVESLIIYWGLKWSAWRKHKHKTTRRLHSGSMKNFFCVGKSSYVFVWLLFMSYLLKLAVLVEKGRPDKPDHFFPNWISWTKELRALPAPSHVGLIFFVFFFNILWSPTKDNISDEHIKVA